MIILDVEGKCKGFFEKNRKKLKGGSRSGIISNIWASILSKNGGYRVSMIKIKDYVRVGSLEEAYELNQKRSACILGGIDRKSTRLNSSHSGQSRMPSSA